MTAIMKGNRRTNTKPEIAVRSALHRRGLRFRKDTKVIAAGIAVKTDIVFPTSRVAVFVDGCFWHNCPKHGRQPRANTEYWGPKLERNRRRDELVTKALRADGWHVIRVWEHEHVETAVARIARAVSTRSAKPARSA